MEGYTVRELAEFETQDGRFVSQHGPTGPLYSRRWEVRDRNGATAGYVFDPKLAALIAKEPAPELAKA